MAEPPAWGFGGLAPETRWLLGHGLPTDLSPPSAPLDTAQWEQLRREAAMHRLEGHLVAAVGDGTLAVSPQQRAEAAAIEVALTRTRVLYDEVCRPVLALLADAAIPIRLIKGSSLGWCDYPDPQLRPTADLDLLVPGTSLYAAVAVLVDAGGEPVNPEPSAGFARSVFKGLTVKMPSGLEVDLHRILSWGPLGVRVPEVDLWGPGRSFDRLGQSFTTLDTERTLIHMSAHLLLLGAFRASELRDVAQVVSRPGLDARRTLEIARRWGHEALLAVALKMAERDLRLAPTANPLSTWAASYRVSRRDETWLRIDRPDAPVRGVEPLAVLLELPGIQARRTMLRALFAPREGTDPTFGSRLTRTVRSVFSGYERRGAHDHDIHSAELSR